MAVMNIKGPTGAEGPQGVKGDPGPQGPAGPSPVSVYEDRADIVSDSIVYRGEADPGSLDADPVWRLKKILISSELISSYWAEGSADFDKVWDDRLSYLYA